MLSNRTLLNKTTFTKMTSLPNIVLEAEEADRFLDYVVDQSVMKKSARIIRMQKETKNIRALGLGTAAILHPGATFSASDYKKTFSENKIALTSKKVRGCIVIYDDDLEDNIEGDAFVDHIMRMVAAGIANELDEAFWIGDTQGFSGFPSTDIRSLWDGWRYRLAHSAAGETYNNAVSGGCTILDAGVDFNNTTAQTIAERAAAEPWTWEFKFGKMIKSLPSEYKKDGLRDLRFFTNDQVVQDYVDAFAARETDRADRMILDGGEFRYGQVPIIPCPLMPITMEADTVDATKMRLDLSDPTTGVYTDCTLTHRSNFIIGLQRDIKIEPQREAADEAWYWFYSLRADVAMENPHAAVLTENLKVA